MKLLPLNSFTTFRKPLNNLIYRMNGYKPEVLMVRGIFINRVKRLRNKNILQTNTIPIPGKKQKHTMTCSLKSLYLNCTKTRRL